jgi:hypothetical protein
MSYNGSGTFVPPAGQPVASGTVIQSTTFNNLVADIGNTFNNVLPRDGQASMAGQLKIIDGTSTTPGFAFNSETSTGFYRPGTGMLALVASGVEGLRFNNSGRVLIGTTTDDGTNKLQVNGGAKVTGVATLGSTIAVTGAATLGSTLGVAGNATVGGTLGVTGVTTLNNLVGIGINPPDSLYKLRVVGAGRFGDTGTGSDYVDLASTNGVTLRLQAQGSNSVATLGTSSNHPLTLFTNNTEALRIDTSGRLFVGATASYQGYTSAQTINYAGGSVTYGVALKPSSSTADTNAITFLSSSSTYPSASSVGAIQHQATDAALNLSGTWKLNGYLIASTNQPTLIKPTIKGYIEQFQSLAPSATVTVDPIGGTVIELSITQNTTIALPAAIAGMSYTIIAAYAGAFSLTFTGGSTLRWAGGTAPGATSISGKSDKYVFTCGSSYTLAQDGGRGF